MSVTTVTHVNFDGEAREALTFYQSVFGGDVSIATYADIHAVEDPSQEQKVAFGRIDAPSGFTLMAYDVQPSKALDRGVNAFYVTLQGTDGDEIVSLWSGLTDSAQQILIDLGPAPFSALYGMVTDRFGVTWIVGADTAPAPR